MSTLIKNIALIIASASTFAVASSASANDALEPIADGPPLLIESNAAVKEVPTTSLKENEEATKLSTQIKEDRQRGTGINEIRVQYKNLPEYQLRQEIGDRAGEKAQSDIDSNTAVPQWQIGSW